MSVTMSPNIHHESVRLGMDGSLTNPKTKEPVKLVDDPYVPAPADVTKAVEKKPETDIIDPPPRTLSEIKEAIKKVEAHLAILQEVKKQKVAEMKKELEEAE